jgi:hypothetical protein
MLTISKDLQYLEVNKGLPYTKYKDEDIQHLQYLLHHKSEGMASHEFCKRLLKDALSLNPYQVHILNFLIQNVLHTGVYGSYNQEAVLLSKYKVRLRITGLHS